MVDNLIRLFESEDIEFDTNGIGVLVDVESCLVTEERNGVFELELTYPINGRHYEDILLRRIIVAKSNPYSEPQPFRIYEISKPINGIVTISAEHISYDLSGYPIQPFNFDDNKTKGKDKEISIRNVFTKIEESCLIDCPFTFWTNKENTKKGFEVSTPCSIRSLLGGTEGSILDSFGGGEYEFDKFSIKLWANRGTDKGVTIRYGKNLTNVKQEESCSSVYTGVYPYWTSEVNNKRELFELTEKIVYAESGYNFKRILPLDLTEKFEKKPKEEDLKKEAENYIKNNDIIKPKVSIDISFEQLSKTTDYKDYAELEEVKLCDTVTVEFPKLGVSATAKCVKTVYDAVLDKYNKIELGSIKSNLSHSLSIQNKTIDSFPDRVDKAINLATGNYGGYVVIHNSNGDKLPDEILIMDKDDMSKAQNIWRWNLDGLSFLKRNEDGTLTKTVAIEQTGKINADFIKTGTLSAIDIEGCRFRSTNELDMNGVRKPVFEVTAEGEVTALKGNIGGCEIADGKLTIPGANITGKLKAVEIEGCIIVGVGFKSTNELDINGEKKPVFEVKGNGTIIARAGEIGGCEIQNGVLKIKNANIGEKLTADSIDASRLQVAAANITGKLVATQIDVENLEVSGRFVLSGATIGNLDNNSDVPGYLIESNGLFRATNAVIGGTIYANAGQIAGLEMLVETADFTSNEKSKVIRTNDNNFEVRVSKAGSSIKILNIDGKFGNFIKSVTTSELNIGTIQIKDKLLYINGKKVISFEYIQLGSQVKATLYNNATSSEITIKITNSTTGKPYILKNNAYFSFQVHYTWGGWSEVLTEKIEAGSSEKKFVYSNAFWGYDDSRFISNNLKEVLFNDSDAVYIDFSRHISPYNNDQYDIGSDSFKWRNLYLAGNFYLNGCIIVGSKKFELYDNNGTAGIRLIK